MELLPSDVEARTFHVVRKGYDPDEVQAFLKKVALQMSSLEERAKIALVKADRLERKLFDAQRRADPIAGAYDDAMEVRRRLIADAEAEAERIRIEAETVVQGTRWVVPRSGEKAPAVSGDEAARIAAEANRILEEARADAARIALEAEAVLADARGRAERIVASAVATADRTRDDRSKGITPRIAGSDLVEPTPREPQSALTVDLSGETPRIEVTPAVTTNEDAKPSRYMSRSAGLPRLGEGAGSVLQDMAKVRKREED